jgi:hypothetical protein
MPPADYEPSESLGESKMAKNERRTARMPAAKYPKLRKKMQKGKIQDRQVKKK